MVIFVREFRRNLQSWLVWTVILIAIAVSVVSAFPSVAQSQADAQKVLAGFPKGLLAALGLDRTSMFTFLGYYAVKGLTLTTLLSGIYAMLLAAGIIAKEESDKTIEFLLARPITRTGLVAGKVAGAWLLIILLNVVETIAVYAGAAHFEVGDYNGKAFLLLAAGGLLVDLSFAAFGFVLAVLVVRPRALYSLSVGTVIAAYMLNIVSKLSPKLEGLRWLSPFAYADPPDIISRQTIGGTDLALFAVLIVGLTAAAFLLYQRKDITV